MRLRLNVDVHLIVEPLPGHRTNCKSIIGIQDIYQFRSIKGKQGIVYTREDMCFCAMCILGKYNQCLTNSVWKHTNVQVPQIKDVNRIFSIAKFYHVDNWITYNDDYHPLVGFITKAGLLQIATLNRKPF